MLVWSNGILGFVFIGLMCFDNILMYNQTVKNNKLTEKQKAYILSIKSSLTMFLLGCVSTIEFVRNNYTVNSNQVVNQLGILCFISYLICDCVIGKAEYPKYMQSLSGYTHHIAYIIINIVSLISGQYGYYMLYMIEELPTILLSIGSYNKQYRNDNLFGLTFFATRIVYHVLLTWFLRHDKLIVIFSLLVLPLHVYWFYGWCNKFVRKKKSKISLE